MIRIAALFASSILLLFGAHVQTAGAHALEPGYLEIEPLGSDDWQITWRKPIVGSEPMAIDAILPETCAPRQGPEPRYDGRAFITGWVATCSGGITKAPLTIEGLSSTATDVLVRYVPAVGDSAQSHRLSPSNASVTLPEAASIWQVFGSYISLGIDHILGGVDHLLFVLALMLLIRDVRKLVGAITAFTVAHSITLGAAALGWIALPVPPVEAVIALSIVFLAGEIVAPAGETPRLSERAPWLVSFAFGLLHGMGFASALRDIGLPPDDVLAALLAFNLGVEAGQLLFIAAILAVLWLGRRIIPGIVDGQLRRGAPAMKLAAYAIGGIASYWTIDRIAGFLT
jgi:hydrogenase/urease accessory protein HupE